MNYSTKVTWHLTGSLTGQPDEKKRKGKERRTEGEYGTGKRREERPFEKERKGDRKEPRGKERGGVEWSGVEWS